ncbi:hypothetical protein KPL37_17535 [Clostridium frigoris]|uniref:Uncharacterized protein n=1 Tax=Clostridium frigoris TaxID=205327 RepID=A0ABS6BY31_9CLOT|nr:hypothetical protein [Clostridium frigoris]MBU3161512.1 hypothetical protein [Clostridium frigoris]
MLKKQNMILTIQCKILESSKGKLNKQYYTRILTIKNSFKEIYLNEKLIKGATYDIKFEIQLRWDGYRCVNEPVVTKIEYIKPINDFYDGFLFNNIANLTIEHMNGYFIGYGVDEDYFNKAIKKIDNTVK